MRPTRNTIVDQFIGSFILLFCCLCLLGFCLFWYKPSEKTTISEQNLTGRTSVSHSSTAKALAKIANQSKAIESKAQKIEVAVDEQLPEDFEAVAGKEDKLAADIKLRLSKAMDLVDDDKVDDAIPILEQILKEDKNNELALIELGMIQLIDLKDTPTALSFLERALRVNPNNSDIISEIAGIYESAQLGDQGLSFFEELNSENPDNPNVASGLAQMLSQKRRYQDAQPYYEMVAQKTRSPEAYGELALNYSKLGQNELAIEYRKKAIEQRENNYQVQSPLGMNNDEQRQHRDGLILDYIKLAQEQINSGDMQTANKTLEELHKMGITDAEIAEISQRSRSEKIGF